jgi:hypothetical protein
VARSVFYRFSDDQDIVVDFSAGYGGRMFGALSMARHYIGSNPAVLRSQAFDRC